MRHDSQERRTTPVLAAKLRKQENRAARMLELQQEAAAKGIDVPTLRQEKFEEVQQIRRAREISLSQLDTPTRRRSRYY